MSRYAIPLFRKPWEKKERRSEARLPDELVRRIRRAHCFDPRRDM
jgi:hypothetical protein